MRILAHIYFPIPFLIEPLDFRVRIHRVGLSVGDLGLAYPLSPKLLNLDV